MLKIYKTEFCPFCHKVIDAAEELGLEEGKHFVVVDAGTPEGRDELMELGGKTQVPYLYIEEEERGFYESLDIINYLKENADTLKGG